VVRVVRNKIELQEFECRFPQGGIPTPQCRQERIAPGPITDR
jgi:hypothetical protein